MPNALIHRPVKHLSLLLFVLGVAGLAYILYIHLFQAERDTQSVPDYIAPVASLSTDLARESLTLLEQDLLYISNLPLTRSAFFELHKGWEALDQQASSRIKQLYVTDNPYGEEKKEFFDFAPDGSDYSAIHKEHHPRMRSLIQSRNYDDLLFVTANNDIIYSVHKPDYFTEKLGKVKGLSKDLQAILQKPLDKNHLITISQDGSGKGTILAAHPIQSPFGEHLGKLVILSDLDALQAQVEGNRHIYLTDNNLAMLHVVSGDPQFFEQYLLPMTDTTAFNAAPILDGQKQLGYVIARPIELAGSLYYAVHFFPHQSGSASALRLPVEALILLGLSLLSLLLSHIILRNGGQKPGRMLGDALSRLATGKPIRGNLAYLDQVPFGREVRQINKHLRNHEDASEQDQAEEELDELSDVLTHMEEQLDLPAEPSILSEPVAEEPAPAEPEHRSPAINMQRVQEQLDDLETKVCHVVTLITEMAGPEAYDEASDILRNHRVDLQEYDELVQDASFRVGRLAEQARDALESWETSSSPDMAISKGSINSALEIIEELEAKIRPIIESSRSIDPDALEERDMVAVKQALSAVHAGIRTIHAELQAD